MIHPNKEIMQRAIDLAKESHKKGSMAIAAVIVKGDEIISEAVTSVLKDNNPTNHAEMNAIRKAAEKIKFYSLKDCWLYSTFEPRPMCASAAVWASMAGIVYGSNMDDRNERYTQRILVKCEDILKKGEPSLKLYKDFMRDECKELLVL